MTGANNLNIRIGSGYANIANLFSSTGLARHRRQSDGQHNISGNGCYHTGCATTGTTATFSGALTVGSYSSGNTVISGSGATIIRSSAANIGILQLSSQAATYFIRGGNNYGYTSYHTGGYHRWFGSDGSEDMRLDSTGLNVSVGTLEMGGTTVIDASRNLTNIGTISSGVVTATSISLGDGNIVQWGAGTATYIQGNQSSQYINFIVNGSLKGGYSSTGLAVTGAISATTTINGALNGTHKTRRNFTPATC